MALLGALGGFPRVTVTVGSAATGTRQPIVTGLETGSAVGAGYTSLRGTITDEERLAAPSIYRAWTPVEVAISDDETDAMGRGTPIFAGYLREPTSRGDGTADLQATGASVIAEDTHQRLMFATDEMTWAERDGDPFGFAASSDDYTVDILDYVRFWLNREIYTAGESAGIAVWMPGVLIKRVSFTLWITTSTARFDLRGYGFTGPSGSTSLVSTISLNGSLRSDSAKGWTLGTPKDGFRIDCYCNAGLDRSAFGKQQFQLKKLRIWGLAYVDGSASDNTWLSGGTSSRSVTNYLAGILGYTTDSTINPATTGTVLPLDWGADSPVSGLLDDLAVREGRTWGVWERDTNAFADPSADGANNAWTKSTGTAGFSLLDDAVRQPTAPSTGTDRITSQTAGQLQDIVFPNTLTHTAQSTYRLWLYGSGGVRRGVDWLISTDDTNFGSSQTALSATSQGVTARWVSRDLTGLITSQAALNGLRVRLTTTAIGGAGPTDTEVDAVYLEQGTGKFRLSFSPWGSGFSQNWFVTKSDIVGRPEPSDDVYNRAVVTYKDVKGKPYTYTLDASPDPLIGTPRALTTGRPKVYRYDISDPQRDSTLAAKIAAAILADYGTLQFNGSIELLSAKLTSAAGVEKPGPQIRAGDMLTITNWDPSGSRTFRIYEASHTQERTRLQIGRRPGALEGVIAQLGKK